MSFTPDDDSAPSMPAAIAGTFPLFIWGGALLINELPPAWNLPVWIDALLGGLFFSILLVPPVSVGVAYLEGFPRWSYPYLTQAIFFSMYLVSASTPGITVLGYPIFGMELWGWKAWMIPLLVVAAIVLTITRSLRPLEMLFTELWEDWTLLLFGFLGLMPLLVAIGFDEIDRSYALPFKTSAVAVMIGSAFIYMLSSQMWLRSIVMATAIGITIAITTVASTAYWPTLSSANAIAQGVAVGVVIVGLGAGSLMLLRGKQRGR